MSYTIKYIHIPFDTHTVKSIGVSNVNISKLTRQFANFKLSKFSNQRHSQSIVYIDTDIQRNSVQQRKCERESEEFRVKDNNCNIEA